MTATDPLATFRAEASPEQPAACDEPDLLDPATPEAAVEEEARALGLDPDALLSRGQEIARDLLALTLGPVDLTAERLDELDRRAQEAAERAAKATAGPWWSSATHEGTPVVFRQLPDVAPNAPNSAEVVFEADWGRDEDAEFVAAAREDVPVLSAAVLTLSAEVRRLRGEPTAAAPDDLAAIEAAAREDRVVAERATPRPWKWWTANSQRELRSEAGRRHLTVAFGQVGDDRVPDIAIQEPNMALIERAVNGMEERADALLRLAAKTRLLEARSRYLEACLRAGVVPGSVAADATPRPAEEQP